MQKEVLTEILNIPHYYVSDILKINEKEIHLKLQKESEQCIICSGCNYVHTKGFHSSDIKVVEDLPISGRRVFLHIKKDTYRCAN